MITIRDKLAYVLQKTYGFKPHQSILYGCHDFTSSMIHLTLNIQQKQMVGFESRRGLFQLAYFNSHFDLGAKHKITRFLASKQQNLQPILRSDMLLRISITTNSWPLLQVPYGVILPDPCSF